MPSWCNQILLYFVVGTSVDAYHVLECCRMDKVIASILVLIAAFIIQYLWQYYRTMTGDDGVVIAVDVAETVSHRDEPQILSVEV